MIGGFVANAINTALDGAPFMQTETFESPNGVAPSPARLALVSFLTLLVIFAVMLFVGKWLWNNVGEGNLVHSPIEPNIRAIPKETDVWFYERVKKPVTPYAFGDEPFEYVPTITIKDPKMATLFALRWGL